MLYIQFTICILLSTYLTTLLTVIAEFKTTILHCCVLLSCELWCNIFRNSPPRKRVVNTVGYKRLHIFYILLELFSGRYFPYAWKNTQPAYLWYASESSDGTQSVRKQCLLRCQSGGVGYRTPCDTVYTL